METAALLTTAPVGSLTVPRIVPPATCAKGTLAVRASNPKTHNPWVNLLPHTECAMMVLLLISMCWVHRPGPTIAPRNGAWAHVGLQVIGGVAFCTRSMRS